MRIDMQRETAYFESLRNIEDRTEIKNSIH